MANDMEKKDAMPAAPCRYTAAEKAGLLRLILPVLMGPLLLIVSLFYNIQALQGGVRFRLSGVRLLFNTLQTARRALLAGVSGSGERTYYILLVTGAVVAIFAFVLALFLACWGAVYAWRYWRAATLPEKRHAALRFRLLFPGRIAGFLWGGLYLIPAAFPAYFSAVSTRFLELGGGAIKLYITLDVPLIVACVLVLLLAASAIVEIKYTRGSSYDLFGPIPAEMEEMAESCEKT